MKKSRVNAARNNQNNKVVRNNPVAKYMHVLHKPALHSSLKKRQHDRKNWKITEEDDY